MHYSLKPLHIVFEGRTMRDDGKRLLDYAVKRREEEFGNVFENEKLNVVYRDSNHAGRVVSKLLDLGTEYEKMRDLAFAISEIDAPNAYGTLMTMAVGAHSGIAKSATYMEPKALPVPGTSIIVMFTQLRFNLMNPAFSEEKRVFEPCVIVKVDDMEELIRLMAKNHAKADDAKLDSAERKTRKRSFQEVTGETFKDKVSKIRKLPDNVIDYGSMSSNDVNKFMKMRRDGKIIFDERGYAKLVEKVKESMSFFDFLKKYS